MTWGIEVAVCVEVAAASEMPVCVRDASLRRAVPAASVVPVCGVVAVATWGIEVAVCVGAAC